MATDPFVATPADQAPRHRQNMPAGVALPPARSWVPGRPGDTASDDGGELRGRPGPNVGYALTLARRASATWQLAAHEHAHDAVAVVAELAMKRAAQFGRAPVSHDIDLAATLLGYADPAPDATWLHARVALVHHAEHDYASRRRLVDAAPDDLLGASVQVVRDRATAWRASIT